MFPSQSFSPLFLCLSFQTYCVKAYQKVPQEPGRKRKVLLRLVGKAQGETTVCLVKLKGMGQGTWKCGKNMTLGSQFATKAIIKYFSISIYLYIGIWVSQVALLVKNLLANAGDTGDLRDVGSIPGLGRSPGGGHSNPLQYSCLENPMDGGVWQATGHRVSKS